MSELQQQAAPGEREMSTLRRCLRRPECYLAIIALTMALAAIDATRAPSQQLTARTYVSAVKAYQRSIRPVTKDKIRCRFTPTCSQYSIEAVERFGIGRGLMLTVRRIASCRRDIAPGTSDPVPVATEPLTAPR